MHIILWLHDHPAVQHLHIVLHSTQLKQFVWVELQKQQHNKTYDVVTLIFFRYQYRKSEAGILKWQLFT